MVLIDGCEDVRRGGGIVLSAKRMMNRVQKLRKKAGLQATDDVEMFYGLGEGLGAELVDAIGQYPEMIKKTLGGDLVDVKARKEGKQTLIEEEQEIGDLKFMLYLVKP